MSYPSSLIPLMSKVNKTSPVFTLSPVFTFGVKYFPFKFTVSNPTCINISNPSLLFRPKAWCVSKNASTVPLNGDITSPFVGITAIPLPNTPVENVESFTSSNGTTTPSIGLGTLVPVFKFNEEFVSSISSSSSSTTSSNPIK